MAEEQPLLAHRKYIRSLQCPITWTIHVTGILALVAGIVGIIFNAYTMLIGCICLIVFNISMILAKYLLHRGNITYAVVLFNIVFNLLALILVQISQLSLAIITLYPIILFTVSILYSSRRSMLLFTSIAVVVSIVALSTWVARYITQPVALSFVAIFAIVCTQALVLAVVWELRKQYLRLFESAQQARQLLQQAHDQLEQTVTQRTQELSDVVLLQHATLESTADGIFVVNDEGHVIVWNQKFLDLWCIPATLMATRNNQQLMDFVRDQLVDPALMTMVVGTTQGSDERADRALLHFKDGRVISRYRQIKQINASESACVMSFRDISDWKLIELRTRALATLSQKLSIAVSVADAARIITGIADDVLHWDACFFNLYDATTDLVLPVVEFDEIDGRRVEALCLDQSCVPSAITRRTMREGGQLFERSMPHGIQLRQFGDVGRESESLMFVPIRHGSTVVGVLSVQSYRVGAYNRSDLELLQALADQGGGALERIRTEAALRQAEDARLTLERKMLESQKLESLGVLAGGIAHDFNNLLAVIFGNVALAQLDLSPDHASAPSIQQVEIAARRAADLTHQMLAYAGKSSISAQPIALNHLITEMDGLLRASLPKHIQVTQQFAEGLPELHGDATQIRQIVMNLLVNAAEAIGETMGTIVVRTGLTLVARSDLAGAAVGADIAEGLYLLVEVVDTGCGMDEITRSKIFDPFFSTKFTGRGLGLAAVLGIARSHQGAILVKSVLGSGSTVRVLLPPVLEPAPIVAATDPNVQRWLGTGQVLVVDDEPSMQAMVSRMLGRLGFAVVQAANGLDALTYFANNAESTTLVLLDLTMPQMSGQRVLQEMRRINPRVPIILMSGYTEEDARGALDAGDATGFLHKPFRLAELSDMLRHAIGAGAAMPVLPMANANERR